MGHPEDPVPGAGVESLTANGVEGQGMNLALSHIEWVRRSRSNKVPGIIAFPGMRPWRPSAASAVTKEKTTALESNHSEGCALVAICPTLIKNTLPGSLVESFMGLSLVKIAWSWKTMRLGRSMRTGAELGRHGPRDMVSS